MAMDDTYPAERIVQSEEDDWLAIDPASLNGGGKMRDGGDPEDTVHDNNRRAGFALVALRRFAEITGSDWDTVIADFLCDLRHLGDAIGYDIDVETERGYGHYRAELRGEL